MSLAKIVLIAVVGFHATRLGSAYFNAPPRPPAIEKVSMGRFGPYSYPGVMRAANGQAHYAEDLMSGFETYLSDDEPPLPAGITMMQPADDCAPPPPAEGDIVALVNFGSVSADSPIFVFDQKVLEADARKIIQHEKAKRKSVLESLVGGRVSTKERLHMADVLVTETAAPVYLVLAVGNGALWNVTLAPGARLSHVALIGQGSMAVANLPPETPVTALTGEKARSCGLKPARRRAPEWEYEDHYGGAYDKPKLAALERRLDNESAIFFARLSRAFGPIDPRYHVTGARFSQALIGPPPQQPVPHRNIGGSQVLAVSDAQLIAATTSQYKEFKRARSTELVEQMFGAPIEELF